MTDKELIRRALLGSREAQDELSNKFIPIPCAFCKADGSNMKVQYDKGVAWMECQACGACGPIAESDDEYTGERAAIRAHNTRPAPPAGRCKDCVFSRTPTKENFKEFRGGIFEYKDVCMCAFLEQPEPRWEDDFCSYFKKREGKNNENN